VALTLAEIQELRVQGKYRETIAAVEAWVSEGFPGTTGVLADRSPFFLEKAWAHYQLGEYDEAKKGAEAIRGFMSIRTDVGESAQRLLAHCAERQGMLEEAENLLRALNPSRARDNLYVTILIARFRQGGEVVFVDAVRLATDAMMRAPYEIVDGHILNNVAWLLYGAREDEMARPFLPILSSFTEGAIGIYEAVGAARNHLAGALFRESHIFLNIADWPKGALLAINESIALWEQLVASEGGQRYQQNLAGAQAQRDKILVRLGS
jgi:tetratricopeptide (TPR) repeat protein